MISDALDLPAPVQFTIIGTDAGTGEGTLVEIDGEIHLSSVVRFSATTGESARRTLQAQIGGVPALIVGVVDVKNGDLVLRITEIRSGSDNPVPRYISARAAFDHAVSAACHRLEDGASRSEFEPMTVPALGPARSMTMLFPIGPDQVVFFSSEPAELEEFEAHLRAFQDLLTYAANSPAGRLTLTLTEHNGTVVEVLGRNTFPPFRHRSKKPIEYIVRLGTGRAQSIIDGWWSARTALRPIPQILAGVRYQPGYVGVTSSQSQQHSNNSRSSNFRCNPRLA